MYSPPTSFLIRLWKCCVSTYSSGRIDLTKRAIYKLPNHKSVASTDSRMSIDLPKHVKEEAKCCGQWATSQETYRYKEWKGA